jgi:hypothetical protein
MLIALMVVGLLIVVLAIRLYLRWSKELSARGMVYREEYEKIVQLTTEEARAAATKLLDDSDVFKCTAAISPFTRADLSALVCEFFSKYAAIEGVENIVSLNRDTLLPYSFNPEYTIIGSVFEAEIIVKGKEETVYDCGTDERVEEVAQSATYPTIYHWIVSCGRDTVAVD